MEDQYSGSDLFFPNMAYLVFDIQRDFKHPLNGALFCLVFIVLLQFLSANVLFIVSKHAVDL